MTLDEQININLETADRFRKDALVMSEDGVRMIINRANLENKVMLEALEKIANYDYRGNRSTESQIAYKAIGCIT